MTPEKLVKNNEQRWITIAYLPKSISKKLFSSHCVDLQVNSHTVEEQHWSMPALALSGILGICRGLPNLPNFGLEGPQFLFCLGLAAHVLGQLYQVVQRTQMKGHLLRSKYWNTVLELYQMRWGSGCTYPGICMVGVLDIWYVGVIWMIFISRSGESAQEVRGSNPRYTQKFEHC